MSQCAKPGLNWAIVSLLQTCITQLFTFHSAKKLHPCDTAYKYEDYSLNKLQVVIKQNWNTRT